MQTPKSIPKQRSKRYTQAGLSIDDLMIGDMDQITRLVTSDDFSSSRMSV
jgi:hypothetical protein